MVIFLIALFLIGSTLAIKPTGSTVSQINSTRAPADAPQQVQALAGNMTELNIVGYSTTQSWQGYFGNVSGTIQLADANDDVLYNWTLASPQGEVYASTQGSVNWDALMCFNFTADDTRASDILNIGDTSQFGMDLNALETTYGISPSDVDGADETFSLAGTHESGGGYKHSQFYSNNLNFAEGECLSTHLRGNNGAIDDSNFEEVLLYDYLSQDIVFASLLDNSILGFDGKSRDFEMLVLEDGHDTDTDETTYFFYVELQ